MTPKEDNLKEQIEDVIGDSIYFGQSIEDGANRLLALFHQREVEARIDELENRLKIQFISSHWQRLCNETNSWAKYVDRRIAQLQHKSSYKEDKE